MTVNGCSVSFNMPQALHDSTLVQGLPPYHRRQAYLVDEYPACPTEWLRSSGRIKSYFVPIVEGRGMWLDFNSCLRGVPQHVAIVVSVQGINAITGLPCKDAQLEQYRDQCPTHKKDFGPDRFCADCGHKWPKQNYLASTCTPPGGLWLDGFRAEDGTVRQYVLTEQKTRGVANALIGGDRVHALGLSFFLSKEVRPRAPAVRRTFGSTSHSLMDCTHDNELHSYCDDFSNSPPGATYGSSVNFMSLTCSSAEPAADMTMKMSNPTATKGSVKMGKPLGKIMARHLCAPSDDDDGSLNWMAADRDRSPTPEPVVTKKLEIAAGARLDQRVYDDPHGLDYWQSEPEGLIVINYCQEAEAERILAAGKVDLSGSREGFLKNVPVGNPV